ncbi:MAG: ABC transporter ATP-binding protein, partial [Culicoidibacterales bacterium]
MNKQVELTNWNVVKKMTHCIRHLIPYIGIAVIFAVCGFLMTILIPTIIIYIAWNALEGQLPSLWVLLILIVFGILRGLFRYGEHYFGHYVAFHTLADFRRLVFQKLRRLAPSHMDKQDSGALLKMIGEDIEAMEVFFAHTLPPITTALIITCILLSYYFIIYPWVAVVALLTYIVLAILLPYVFAKQLQPLLEKQTEIRQTYISLFLESLRGMRDLLQFKKEEIQFEHLDNQSQYVNQCEKKITRKSTIQTITTFLVIGLSIVLVSSLSFNAVMMQQLSVYDATLLIVIFSTSFAPYLELSRLPLGFKRAINAGRHVFSVLDIKEETKTGRQFAENIEKIQMENITFSYSSREQVIFEQMNVAFNRREIIGIIGESGVGKSTIMKLIMRWYDTSQGTILLNHKALSTLDARSVQQHFAYIPQVPQFFNQTLRENLTLGNVDISDEMIMEKAKQCRIIERIMSLPMGLDTKFNQEDMIFSAGELQRLELTRALLKEADCYIFDEPTSNLDSLNEAAFLHVIREHCKGYVFLISHRTSTVACADTVYRVE